MDENKNKKRPGLAHILKYDLLGAVVATQLVELSLLQIDIRSSIPVISQFDLQSIVL